MRQETDWVADWQAWRAAREERLRDPRGFLAVTGLHWLSATPQRFHDVPGTWSQSPGGVVLTVDDDEAMTISGRPLRGTTAIGPVDPTGLTIEFGEGLVEVAERFGRTLLRPRHPDSPTLRAYTGTPSYAPDLRWVLEGRLEAYEQPRPVGVETVVEGMTGTLEARGEVVFTADRRPQRLVALTDPDAPDELWLLFTDETNGVTTYAAGRQFAADLPTSGDRVVLDFNRAVNLPCAYTDFAACPLPPARNHVDVLVEAGERVPPGR